MVAQPSARRCRQPGGEVRVKALPTLQSRPFENPGDSLFPLVGSDIVDTGVEPEIFARQVFVQGESL